MTSPVFPCSVYLRLEAEQPERCAQHAEWCSRCIRRENRTHDVTVDLKFGEESLVYRGDSP